MATAVPPRISDGSDTSSLGVMTGTAAPGSTLDIEGDGVKDAIEKLQKALTPSIVLDRELDARRDDAVRVASGGAYKSPYHDAHHATIVAASALLGRALGEGGVGTGFVYGAETMVRDALLMIDGAARDALRRDEGELPRLFDIAEGMRKKRDDARAAARQLVLAFSRQSKGLGFRERQRMRDAVAFAKAEAMKEAEQEKMRLAKEHESMREELELMQRQLSASREASNAQIVQLTKQVQHERNARGGDAMEHQQTGTQVRAKLEMAEVRMRDLSNQLRNTQREAAIEKDRLRAQLKEATDVGDGAKAHAINARTVLRRQKGRALRERCFRVWKIKAAAYAALKKAEMESVETIKAVKKGYEVQIARTERACSEKVESMRAKLRGRDPRDTNPARALGDSTNQAAKKNGNKAPRSDPWSFLDESTKLEREITKREREEERKARERVAMAMAEDHISKIDEYYAKAAEAARQRNAGDDGPNPEIVMVAHNVSLASRPPPSPMSRPLMSSSTEPRRSMGHVHTYGGGSTDGSTGATPRVPSGGSTRSMIEPTPPRTTGRVPAPAQASSSSESEDQDPWKPRSPEPVVVPPKLGEPAEELAFTESLYGLKPPPEVPLRRRDDGAASTSGAITQPAMTRLAAPRTETVDDDAARMPPPPSRRLESLAPLSGSRPSLAPLMARRDDLDQLSASRLLSIKLAEEQKEAETGLDTLPAATTFIPPPPARSRRESEGSRPPTSGGLGSRPGTAGASRPGTSGGSRPGSRPGTAGVRSSVASLAASEAYTEYSEDFDELPEDLDLP